MRLAHGSGVLVVAAILSGPLAAQTADTPSPIARYVEPLARAREAPPVEIDVTAAPEAKAWAEQARTLVRDWFPHVCQLLATEKYAPPKGITLVFKPDIRVPAY